MQTISLSKVIPAPIDIVVDAYTDHERLSDVFEVRSCTLTRHGATDALVASIKQAGGKEVRRQFEVALADGIDSVPDAPPELRAFFEQSEKVPYWLDWGKLRHAADLLSGIGPAAAPMLMVGLSVTYTTLEDGNTVLLRAGDTRDKAGKRATETLDWVGETGASMRDTLETREAEALL
jgi:hypothetical protein